MTKTKTSGGKGRGTRSGVLRRPPERGLPRLQHEARRHWRRLLEMAPVWAVLFVGLALSCLLPQHLFRAPAVEPGTLAPRTFLADRDLSVVNEGATQAVQDAAREAVLPVYDFDRGVEAQRAQQFGELFAVGREDQAAKKREPGEPQAQRSSNEILTRLRDASQLKISTEGLDLLRSRGFAVDLEDRLSGVARRVLRQGVVAGKDLLLEHREQGITVQELPTGRRSTQLDLFRYLDYPDQVREAVEEDLSSWEGFSTRQRRVLVELLVANIPPNLTFNNSETLALRQSAAQNTGAVTLNVRKGEVIVRKGENVDALKARILAELAGDRNLAQAVLAVLGALLLTLAALVVVWLLSEQEGRHDRSRERFFSESVILLTLHVVGVHFAIFVAGAIANAIPREPFGTLQSYLFAIPFAALALAVVLLYGRNTGLVLSLVGSVLVGHLVGGEMIWKIMFYCLASSLAAVYVIDHSHFRQRSVMTRAGAWIGLVNVFTVLTLKALAGDTAGGWSQLGFDVVCALIGGFLAAAVVSFVVPILEPLLELTTYIKLLELANPNLPLLRRLRAEAPGTFQHSLGVANLAEAGCEAIGRDPLLVHTAALYHDIGKILRPLYFVENQAPGQNPHDKIQPSMSALILINHVKDGLELAHQNHLPKILSDAIAEHHGSRLIKFFYSKAQERCDPETEEIREDDFRYPGPRPQSKEMGVLMLADAVEAASRTLVEPSRQKLKGLLAKLFDDCLHDHQLDKTDLTLGDLSKVEEAFLRVLTNIYHRRIDYPGYNFNQPGGGSSGGGRNKGGKDGAKDGGKDGKDAKDAKDANVKDGKEPKKARPEERSGTIPLPALPEHRVS